MYSVSGDLRVQLRQASSLPTARFNTAANRRLTFGVRGHDELIRHHLGGMSTWLFKARRPQRRVHPVPSLPNQGS